MTFIISSHLLDELAKVVNFYGIIAGGKLVEEISAEALAETCSRQAKIATGDGSAAIKALKNDFPDINAEVRGDFVYAYNYTDKTADLNACLVKAGIPVHELSRSGKDMEEFFIERLGE